MVKKIELQEKGWSEKEIKEAEALVEEDRKHDSHYAKILFWSALLVIIVGNFIVSIVLVPFLLVLNSYILFALVIILGGTIGFLYNFLITDIGHLEKKHHVFAGIVIPLVAVLNLGVVVYATNRFISQLEVANQHNPWVVSIVFATAVILPAIIDKLRK